MVHPFFVVWGAACALNAVGELVNYLIPSPNVAESRTRNETEHICPDCGCPRDDSPPPTPPQSTLNSNLRKRSQSSSVSEATRKLTIIPCKDCGESPCVKISPCNHESLCMGCLSTHVETNDTCPQCKVRIDSCSPNIPSFGKCKSCEKFTKVRKFHPCGYSMSLCNKCFKEL